MECIFKARIWRWSLKSSDESIWINVRCRMFLMGGLQLKESQGIYTSDVQQCTKKHHEPSLSTGTVRRWIHLIYRIGSDCSSLWSRVCWWPYQYGHRDEDLKLVEDFLNMKSMLNLYLKRTYLVDFSSWIRKLLLKFSPIFP